MRGEHSDEDIKIRGRSGWLLPLPSERIPYIVIWGSWLDPPNESSILL